MREMFRHRGMRLVVVANLISMIGSGMNVAAVTWYILQATHSEVSLGLLVALQTLPSLLLLPFSGVLIDREDRRHLMLWLDGCRGLVILLVAVLALTHQVQVWHLYGMTISVAIGFWMFWPTMNALVQELTPEDKLLDSNSLMLAAVQGGWVLAGAMVGFVFNKIGLGGILLIDAATYAVSIACVYQVRKGRVTVSHLAPQSAEAVAAPATAVARYIHELGEGFRYVRVNRRVLLLGLAVIALSLFVLPEIRWIVVAVPIYFLMGSGRGVGGIAIQSKMMEMVPKYFMGRVQNTFFFLASALQICTALIAGEAAHRNGLKFGFWIVGAMYLSAALAAWWPVHEPEVALQSDQGAAD